MAESAMGTRSEHKTPTEVPTRSDTLPKKGKKRSHNGDSIECKKLYRKIRKVDPSESMLSVVKEYAVEKGKSWQSIYRILNDHSEEWKPSDTDPT